MFKVKNHVTLMAFLLVFSAKFGYSMENTEAEAETEICNNVRHKISAKYEYFSSITLRYCESKTFTIDKNEVDFVVVKYGKANDCPSGCFFSNACFIIDDKDVHPYSFHFYGEPTYANGMFVENDESFINLEPDNKYGDRSKFCYNSRHCKSKLSGYVHTLTTTSLFKEFRDKSILKGGSAPPFSQFRYCR